MSGNSTHILAYLSGSMSWGGLEMNQLKNALWMHERGHQVVVIGLVNSPFIQSARENGLRTVLIERHRKYYDFKRGFQLARLITEVGISHLIIRDNRDLSTAVIAKRLTKHRIHLSYFMEMQLGVKKTSIFHTLRYRQIDLWSCPLSWLKEQVLTMTKMPKDRVIVIHSGLELSRFSFLQDKYQARGRLNLPSDAQMVGLIGRFDPHKGQLVLIEALRQLRNASIHVCLLGEPTRGEELGYMERMEELIDNFGLRQRVHIRPFRKDIETFYAAMDIIVMATRSETVGMVTLESMACAKPVIATNSGGSPELLKFGQLGRLVKPSDPNELTEAIQSFFNGQWHVDSDLLVQRAAEFDHNTVCAKVEKALNLI